MATKKKTSKRPTKAKKTARKKTPPKKAPPKKAVKRRPAVKHPKKLAKKKAAPRRAAPKKVATKTPARKKSPGQNPVTFSPLDRGSRSGELSGDLQGLSNREIADSESVDELLEEGNAFEAEVVDGVERAEDEEGKEVRTREVPEDDVPGEYLDEK